MDDYSNSKVVEVIEEWVHSERDRLIMKDRLVNGYTYEFLAEKYELSDRQIKRIIYKQSDIIFRHM